MSPSDKHKAAHSAVWSAWLDWSLEVERHRTQHPGVARIDRLVDLVVGLQHLDGRGERTGHVDSSTPSGGEK